MKILKFKFAEITPSQLHRKLTSLDRELGRADGSPLLFQRPSAQRTYFYTFTNGAVLEKVIQLLDSKHVPFVVVDESDLPPYAKEALRQYRQGGGVIKNH